MLAKCAFKCSERKMHRAQGDRSVKERYISYRSNSENGCWPLGGLSTADGLHWCSATCSPECLVGRTRMVPNELFGSCVVSRQFASSLLVECSFQE